MVDAVPPSQSEQPDVSGLSYEAARDELVRIVATLESGQVGLEESMTLWRRGEALAQHCAAWLDRAQATIADATTDDGATTPTTNTTNDRGAAEG